MCAPACNEEGGPQTREVIGNWMLLLRLAHLPLRSPPSAQFQLYIQPVMSVISKSVVAECALLSQVRRVWNADAHVLTRTNMRSVSMQSCSPEMF